MYRFIFFLIFLTIHSQSYAFNSCGKYVSNNASTNTIVIFINGIDNSLEDACKSSDKLSFTIGIGNYDKDYFYNHENDFVGDTRELRAQAYISASLLKNLSVSDPTTLINNSTTKMQYYQALGKVYNAMLNNYLASNYDSVFFGDSKAGVFSRIATTTLEIESKLIGLSNIYKNIIVVAHSQGNFYIESAYAKLLYNGRSDVVDKIRVVGVASVAATTPNNTYITNSGDNAVYKAQWLNSIGANPYKPLKYSDTLAYNSYLGSAKEIIFHSFTGVYLSHYFYSPEKNNKTYPDIIHDYVVGFFPPLASSFSINPPSPKVGDIITFTPNLNDNTINSVSWSFGDGGATKSSVSSPVQYAYKKAGTYTVQLTATNYMRKTGTATQNITVVPNTPPSSNLLLGSTVTDSCVSCPISTHGNPNNITDGNKNTYRGINSYSGSFNIFLNSPTIISRLVITPDMEPDGTVYYEIQTSNDPRGAIGTWTSHGQKSSVWRNREDFSISLNSNTTGVRVVKVIIHSSPHSLIFLSEVQGFAQ